MDSMRGLLAGSHGQDDGAIESPTSVGVDERRMQVRAYNYWASLLADRAYPSVEDLDLDNAGDFGPYSVLLDFTAGVDNPGLSFLGDKLRAESQIDEDVQYIREVPGRSLLSRLTDHYLQIIANRAPIGFEAEFVNDRGTTIMYRGILLPFSSDDDTIDFIMGVINWKEAVPAEQEEELQLSVEQALRSAPPLTAPVPVWADGPDSEHIDAEAGAGFRRGARTGGGAAAGGRRGSRLWCPASWARMPGWPTGWRWRARPPNARSPPTAAAAARSIRRSDRRGTSRSPPRRRRRNSPDCWAMPG